MSLQTSDVKYSVVCHRYHRHGYRSNENASDPRSLPKQRDDLFTGKCMTEIKAHLHNTQRHLPSDLIEICAVPVNPSPQSIITAQNSG